jgi:hypothetical protein|nr:MAG TPA: hypothetical protein [Caudoviricetes sp.]
MPGKTIGIMMNAGYAGTQSRTADAIIQNRIADGAIAFGQAVVLTADNKWKLVGTGTTAAQVAGIAVREVVQANTFNPQSNPDYLDAAPCDVMVRGNCTVKCQRGTPASGSAVYVRITKNDTYPDAVVGGFEATADGANTIQVDNIEWTTGVMDANNMTEVTVKTRAKG